eukprot:TRINITY_DN895_c0_g2_i1.p1 TRINITY_DN895_c0_g2~~TRINITY_DN895_c0_g2_i1.p1  ORF type:complete len:155 (-),score=27.06 TRINITY_DN895_c0_g2_i1:75-539(-)
MITSTPVITKSVQMRYLCYTRMYTWIIQPIFCCCCCCLLPCLAMIKMAGSMERSTEVMKAMEKVIKLPEIRKNMMDMAREMHKAGVIEDMLTDTLDGLDDQDLEDVANTEVEKILSEVLASHGPLPVAPEPQPEAAADEDDVETMAARLNALRS